MTRVNVVDPKILSDQHLLAERLELNFVISSAWRSMNSKRGLRVSPEFTLGIGHVSFFHDKIGYIVGRYGQLTNEMVRRGMKPKAQLADISWVPHRMMGNYLPKTKDFDIIKERIKTKLNMKPEWYRYNGKPLSESFWRYYE